MYLYMSASHFSTDEDWVRKSMTHAHNYQTQVISDPKIFIRLDCPRQFLIY